MVRLVTVVFSFIALQGDGWKPLIVDTNQNYLVKNKGKIYTSSSPAGREDKIKSDLVINGDSLQMIRSGYSFPLGDTVLIELFETTATSHYLFDIVIVNNQYLIRYSREINNTEIIQTFRPEKSKLVFNSADFSNGKDIRGHVDYTGRCITGCSENGKKVRIKGNFVVKINRYETR